MDSRSRSVLGAPPCSPERSSKLLSKRARAVRRAASGASPARPHSSHTHCSPVAPLAGESKQLEDGPTRDPALSEARRVEGLLEKTVDCLADSRGRRVQAPQTTGSMTESGARPRLWAACGKAGNKRHKRKRTKAETLDVWHRRGSRLFAGSRWMSEARG